MHQLTPAWTATVLPRKRWPAPLRLMKTTSNPSRASQCRQAAAGGSAAIGSAAGCTTLGSLPRDLHGPCGATPHPRIGTKRRCSSHRRRVGQFPRSNRDTCPRHRPSVLRWAFVPVRPFPRANPGPHGRKFLAKPQMTATSRRVPSVQRKVFARIRRPNELWRLSDAPQWIPAACAGEASVGAPPRLAA